MESCDYDDFSDLLAGVGDVHGKVQSPHAIAIWWNTLRPYDLAAVRDALSRHVASPDNGQFMPKPGDVIKLIMGTTVDKALLAWAKVDKALRQVGTWRDVAFDDPLIHRVVQDMGGWIGFGLKTDHEWPFVAKEFDNRYRGYRIRADRPAYPPLLVGSSNTQNGRSGREIEPPMLVGDPRLAADVIRGGSDEQMIGLHQAGRMAPPTLPAAPAPRHLAAPT